MWQVKLNPDNPAPFQSHATNNNSEIGAIVARGHLLHGASLDLTPTLSSKEREKRRLRLLRDLQQHWPEAHPIKHNAPKWLNNHLD